MLLTIILYFPQEKSKYFIFVYNPNIMFNCHQQYST